MLSLQAGQPRVLVAGLRELNLWSPQQYELIALSRGPPLCSDFVLAELPSPLKYPQRWPVGSRWVRSPQHGVSTGCCALRAVPQDLQNSYAGWEMQNVSLLFLQALMLLRAKHRLQISVCVVERHSEVYCLKEATFRRTQTSSSVWLRGAVSSRQEMVEIWKRGICDLSLPSWHKKLALAGACCWKRPGESAQCFVPGWCWACTFRSCVCRRNKELLKTTGEKPFLVPVISHSYPNSGLDALKSISYLLKNSRTQISVSVLGNIFVQRGTWELSVILDCLRGFFFCYIVIIGELQKRQRYSCQRSKACSGFCAYTATTEQSEQTFAGDLSAPTSAGVTAASDTTQESGQSPRLTAGADPSARAVSLIRGYKCIHFPNWQAVALRFGAALCGTDRRVRMGAAKEKALGEGRQSSACLLPGGLSSRSPPTGMRAVRVYSAVVCAGIWGLLLLLNFQIQSTKGPLVVRDSRKHVGMAMEEYAPQPWAVPGGSGMAVQPPALPIPPSSTRPGASSAVLSWSSVLHPRVLEDAGCCWDRVKDWGLLCLSLLRYRGSIGAFEEEMSSVMFPKACQCSQHNGFIGVIRAPEQSCFQAGVSSLQARAPFTSKCRRDLAKPYPCSPSTGAQDSDTTHRAKTKGVSGDCSNLMQLLVSFHCSSAGLWLCWGILERQGKQHARPVLVSEPWSCSFRCISGAELTQGFCWCTPAAANGCISGAELNPGLLLVIFLCALCGAVKAVPGSRLGFALGREVSEEDSSSARRKFAYLLRETTKGKCYIIASAGKETGTEADFNQPPRTCEVDIRIDWPSDGCSDISTSLACGNLNIKASCLNHSNPSVSNEKASLPCSRGAFYSICRNQLHTCFKKKDAQERAAAGMEGHGNAVWVTSADAQGAAKPLKATGNETLSY
ncbi:hypothetical protein Anapl_04593 [Anas platyrhynchos]|uniref:Uncharacterized protein n=1 Tax=Anas platyrhynchos TaxID=8839 RepID=R0LIC5_ANAPL|nr:hypothetical protein Anapl_04593 [Anas platyrhynchos]